MSVEHGNVDPQERRKFDHLAASWWDPEGESRPLHEINPARLRFVQERCRLTDARAIDVGCGGGILSEALAAAGARVTGLDIAERALAVARLHLHESELSVDYQCMTAEAFAAASPGQADLVTCMELLEHVPDPAAVVSACAGMLKAGGDLFLSTLNRTPAAFALAIVGAEHIARLVPRGTHRYDRFIRPSELSAWLRAAGLEVCEITGLHYNPISRSAALGGSVGVNYLLHARKPERSELR
ncbi:MAG: bifunctional 2-polyprenyl-6-hydroxyphenol methylase/3-demethylubiquinol 3-O-methyltransferase UbiG [Xanthomonadales bacterium]|nr:bifunctional 2-polyprenyl-6-hydroxyphenol methylase/3-demethylubiquinol 3-O-methyltransferase UbiG [Xanthomonadales bacterium]